MANHTGKGISDRKLAITPPILPDEAPVTQAMDTMGTRPGRVRGRGNRQRSRRLSAAVPSSREREAQSRLRLVIDF